MTVWTLAIPSGMFLDSFHIRLFKFSWFLTANAIFLRHCSCSAAHLHWVFESEKILRHCPPCQDTNCWVFLKITGKMPFLLQWTITDILIQIHSYDAQTYYIHPVNTPARNLQVLLLTFIECWLMTEHIEQAVLKKVVIFNSKRRNWTGHFNKMQ